MNIKTSNVENQKNIQNSQNNSTKSVNKENVNFSDELKELENNSEIKNNEECEVTKDMTIVDTTDSTDAYKSDKININSIQDSPKNQEVINDEEKKQTEDENNKPIDKNTVKPQAELNEQIQQKDLFLQQAELSDLKDKNADLDLEQYTQSAIVHKDNFERKTEGIYTEINNTEKKQTEDENNNPTDKTTERHIWQYSQSITVQNEHTERKIEDIYPECNDKNNEETIQHDQEINNALANLTNVFNQLNKEVKQTDELKQNKLKITDNPDDKNNEDNSLINNDFNITEKDKLTPQISLNMHFSGDGQPFSSLMNEEHNNSNKNNILGNSQTELEEEEKVLSTLEENIEIANKRTQIHAEAEPKEFSTTANLEIQQNDLELVEEKTVTRNNVVKKINVDSGVTIETVVKYDNIIMNEVDVDVFVGLVQNNEVNLNNIASESVSKNTQVSKTLADMLVKAQETNQPLRIDFDNDISVIIRISRDGKLSADFLPSSQIAETYLKENLPILRQKFDENNIEYDELNQRDSKDRNRENNKRKDRNNE